MAKKKPKTIGERVAAKLFPCVDVFDQITVAIPYHITLGTIVPAGDSEATLIEIRQRVANYVDRLVAKEPPHAAR